MPYFNKILENLLKWWYYYFRTGDDNLKISTKGRYALRMMIDLAQNQGDGYVSLKDIANRQEISKKYLEQIVAILNKPDILRTNRGYQGGYRLAKKANEYTVGDILRLTEGGIAPVSCLENSPIICDRADTCVTLPVWKGLYRVISEYVDSITLQDIIDKNSDISSFDYVI
jgi:Rrf2 family protein